MVAVAVLRWSLLPFRRLLLLVLLPLRLWLQLVATEVAQTQAGMV